MKRTTKLLALLLSMLMIVLSMPFAISAADTITLSKDKVIITRPINPIKREDLMNGAADDSFSIYAVSDTEIVTENGDYHLELGVDYTGDETVNFDWLRCDENGNIPDYRTDVYLGNKSYLDWYIPLENQTDYIKGVVTINKVSKQIVFKVTYTPKDNYEEEIIPDTIYNLVPVGDLDVRVYDCTVPVTLRAEVEYDGEAYADYQWYRCDAEGNPLMEVNYGMPISWSDSVVIDDITYDEMMIPRYYRCNAMIGNTVKSLLYTVMLLPMGITEGEDPWTADFNLAAVGDQEKTIYDPNETIIFKAEIEGMGNANALFRWFYGTDDGMLQNTICKSDTLVINGIDPEDMMIPQYYKCVAILDGVEKELTFTAMLAPMGIEFEEDESVPEFKDVKTGEWYFDYVVAAQRMGLINGKTANSYAPMDEMTVSEAVKLAVCMHILYNGGDPNKDIGIGKDVWYSTYMEYAVKHGITDSDMSSRATEKITRLEYVYIFSKALPRKTYLTVADVYVGKIPDLRKCVTKQEQAAYLFYRAGIIRGTDAKGTFNPGGYITRAEVATILIRMMDPSYRGMK